jgi:hypothetical protein
MRISPVMSSFSSQARVELREGGPEEWSDAEKTAV